VFVGLGNFRRLFTVDPAFWPSLRATGLLVVLYVPLSLVLGLALARSLRVRPFAPAMDSAEQKLLAAVVTVAAVAVLASQRPTAAAVLAALALGPAAVLLFVTLALGELMRLPQRVRSLPGEVETHRRELERLARDVRDARAARARRLVALWRIVRLQATARETLAVYAPIAALLSVPLLAAAVVAAFAVPVEAVVALVLLIVLA
jgi:ABC-type sugar transport system permease subunit